MQSEQTEFRDRMIMFLMDQPDGEIIEVKTDKQRNALKEIIDGQFAWINNFDITFSNDMNRIKVRKLTMKNYYEIPKVPQTLFSNAF